MAKKKKPVRAKKSPAKKKLEDLTLEEIDQKIRINELKHTLEEMGGPSFVSDDCPPDLAEAFLKSVHRYETSELTTSFKMMTSEGLVLPPPDQLNDKELPKKLAELIERLAKRRTFISHTNHLSDRELYERLWTDSLREERPDMGTSKSAGFGISMIGSGSDEDIDISMKYYADAAERRRFQKQFPDYKMPKREKPPYDRDRHLPQLTLEPPDESEGIFNL